MIEYKPLKNKGRFVLSYEIFDDAKKVPESCRQTIFEKHDLVSAIEWLKQKIVETGYKDVSYVPTIKLIDVAFADVMK